MKNIYIPFAFIIIIIITTCIIIIIIFQPLTKNFSEIALFIY